MSVRNISVKVACACTQLFGNVVIMKLQILPVPKEESSVHDSLHCRDINDKINVNVNRNW